MTLTTMMQGSFISTGANVVINLPMGVAWMKVWNVSNILAQTNASGYEFYAFDAGTGLGNLPGFETILESNAGSTAVNLVPAVALMTNVNTATALPGAPVAITTIIGGTPPTVTTPSTAGLSTGSVVEIINVLGVQQFGGMPFTVGAIAVNALFQLAYGPTVVAGTTGFYRIIPYDPIFYPVNRYITAITVGATTQVQMSVNSTYQLGQLVRLVVPAAYGPISQNINGLTGTIIAFVAATNTITLNINSTGFGAFVFPLTTAVPFTQAQVVPVGSGAPDAGETSNSLNDATVNLAQRGVLLIGGTILTPAGIAGNTICWQAGTVFNLP